MSWRDIVQSGQENPNYQVLSEQGHPASPPRTSLALHPEMGTVERVRVQMVPVTRSKDQRENSPGH